MCPRKAVYEAQDAPRGELPEHLARIFRRGHAFGKIVRDDITGALRAQGQRPVAEAEVPWPVRAPIGTGHADLYIPRARRVIEVFSTDGTSFPAHKGLQGAGYAVNHPRADEAVVLVVDRATGDERVYPLNLDVLEPKVRAIEAAVVEGIAGGDMPPRAARAPGAWPCSDCVFRRHCWDGVELPPLEEIPEAVDDARALADLEDAYAEAKAVLDQAELDRNAARAKLAPLVDGTVKAGDILLRRTRVSGRTTFAVGAFQAAGHQLPEEADAFISVSGGHDRWTVKRSAA